MMSIPLVYHSHIENIESFSADCYPVLYLHCIITTVPPSVNSLRGSPLVFIGNSNFAWFGVERDRKAKVMLRQLKPVAALTIC